ncbi:MAG: beta strand repeat-containing protein, partial [Pirellulales bacterium]
PRWNSNEVGGGIAGTGYGILVSGGGVAALSNAGSITGPDALIAAGTIGSLANAATGAITGDVRGVRIEATGAVSSFDNAGTISATAGTALQLDFGATLDSLHNTGTVTSTEGMVSAANLAMLVNEGRLAGTGNRGLGLISGTAGTVLNTGTISGLVTGVASSVSLDRISNDARGSLISGGWRGVQFDDPTKIVEVLNNVGKIEGSDGIENRGRINNVVNYGEILGTGEWGMSNGSASNVVYLLNFNESVIQGAISGVGTSGTVGHLANNGTVRGTTGDGIAVASTGMMWWLENRSSGTFVGGHRGVSNHGILDEFTNDGVVTSPGESGLFSAPGSTLGILTNTGTIQADFYGILASGISGTITNLGIVSATTYHGFVMNGGGAKLDTLANSGTISGGQRGVLVDVDATLSTFDNSGLVTTPGDWGVFVADKARLLTLTNAGEIVSTASLLPVIAISAPVGTLLNSGTVAGRVGIDLDSSGSVGTLEITATGAIDATRIGIVADGGGIGAIVNAGRIAGGHHGVVGQDGGVALTNLPGGTITGTMFAGVRLENGASMLVNDAGAVIESLGEAGIEY